MYDTINLWLPIDKIGSFNKSKIKQNLSNITEHKKDDGQIYLSGHLNNYKVTISGQGVSLKGSLAKYFLPDNFHTLTRSDTAIAFEMMSDELLLPIQKAKVNRIDFSQNLLMNHKPEAYYNFLGESQYYNRLIQPKSLYYSNGLRTKLFYNKIAESKAKKLILPKVWDGQNVLRYEMRFTSRLPQQFKQPEVTARNLSEEKFYMKTYDKWFAEYESINKLHSINFNLSDMKSPKDFWKQINLMAINMIGQDKIMQEIENLRHQKAFSKPEYYSRLKKDVRELTKTPELTTSSDLVAELDKKMKAAKKYYR
ncbi:MAG: phage/plasmid replication domain-containing protein [Polaribacter sp.]|uniref:phage/plasmid replication domain-containing protein n=1 Tax=Polaribacter sp. TaxID=1920175 RepID=UPI003EF20E8C